MHSEDKEFVSNNVNGFFCLDNIVFYFYVNDGVNKNKVYSKAGYDLNNTDISFNYCAK